jgi:cell wall-associated NlpC family hydrolase
MKELLLIGTTIITVATSSIGAGSAQGIQSQQAALHIRGNHTSIALIHKAELKAEAQKEMLYQMQLQDNTNKVNDAIKSLKSHVGKTWYVFSGNTPAGWDCSGLTMWFYEQLNIELEHRASKQDNAGKNTNDPKPGDLVVFKYNGSNDAYHVGIYIGNGNMIHAPKHGHLTRIESIDQFAGDYSKVSYRTFIETNL